MLQKTSDKLYLRETRKQEIIKKKRESDEIPLSKKI